MKPEQGDHRVGCWISGQEKENMDGRKERREKERGRGGIARDRREA